MAPNHPLPLKGWHSLTLPAEEKEPSKPTPRMFPISAEKIGGIKAILNHKISAGDRKSIFKGWFVPSNHFRITLMQKAHHSRWDHKFLKPDHWRMGSAKRWNRGWHLQSHQRKKFLSCQRRQHQTLKQQPDLYSEHNPSRTSRLASQLCLWGFREWCQQRKSWWAIYSPHNSAKWNYRRSDGRLDSWLLGLRWRGLRPSRIQ